MMSMNEKLREVMNVVPIMQEVGGDDVSICVWNENLEVVQFFKAKTIDFELKPGYKAVDESDPIHEAIRTGKVKYNKVSKDVFGSAFEGKIVPIFDGNKVVGALTYTKCSETRNSISSNIEILTDSINKTGGSIVEISEGAKSLSENMNNVQEIASKVEVKLEEAMEVVMEIKQNAKLSNILALNASIESARAGEAGKGFTVVSDEMRKFSQMSGQASEKINKTLDEINKALDEVKKSVVDSTEIVSKQSNVVDNLNDTFEVVNSKASEVTEVCKKLNEV